MLEKRIFVKPETDPTVQLQAKGKIILQSSRSLVKTEVKNWFKHTLLLKLFGLTSNYLKKKKKRRGSTFSYPVRYKTIVLRLNKSQILTSSSKSLEKSKKSTKKERQQENRKKEQDKRKCNFEMIKAKLQKLEYKATNKNFLSNMLNSYESNIITRTVS